MKRTVFLLSFSFSLLISSLSGQNSLLWKISGNGLQQPSYLFGTIHIICEDDFFLDSAVMKAIESSTKVVFEVNMADPKMMQKAQAGSINPGYKNFKNELADDDRFYLDSCLKADMKVGLDQMGVLKPWALMMAYSIGSMIDCEKTKQYETELLGIATSQNLSIDELETIEYQLALFDSIPLKKQIAMLMEAVREKEQDKVDFHELLNAYINQDIVTMHQLMMQEEEMVEYGDLFFYTRNKNWVPKIETMAAENTIFIAVGAGHLGGKGGLIDLLKNKGYKVEPVI